jgi:Zn finger protein HypA/HybF involved in hydrogenase expression
MSVVVCPWCQSEIPQEEGEQPDKYCPVCENELDGYRTLKVGIGDDMDLDDEDEEEDAIVAAPGDGELHWAQDGELTEKNEALLKFEETVEGLLDEQDTVPECPQCREYMLEAGEQTVTEHTFRGRVPASLGQPVLEAPFTLTVYVCPSCFTVQHSVAEQGRFELARRLSGTEALEGKASKS